MENQLKETKISKIYELVQERWHCWRKKQLLETALNKLLKRRNLTEEFIKTMHT
jgi:hypothetical protein